MRALGDAWRLPAFSSNYEGLSVLQEFHRWESLVAAAAATIAARYRLLNYF